MNPKDYQQLAFISALLAVTITIPAQIMMLVGPFVFYALAFTFAGKKWGFVYVSLQLTFDLPQTLGVMMFQSTVATQSASIAMTGDASSNPFIPYMSILWTQYPMMAIAITLALCGFALWQILQIVLIPWIFVRKLRRRVPRSLWP